jgi:hypothetical protein
MQTFLPYASYIKSAKALDWRRLGKQRAETLQMLRALDDINFPNYGWKNHSATRMWRGYEVELALYGITICKEWIKRGYKDYTLSKIEERYRFFQSVEFNGGARWIRLPPWFGDPKFHEAHQSNLLRKDPIYYGKFGWTVPSDLPYVWPV